MHLLKLLLKTDWKIFADMGISEKRHQKGEEMRSLRKMGEGRKAFHLQAGKVGVFARGLFFLLCGVAYCSPGLAMSSSPLSHGESRNIKPECPKSILTPYSIQKHALIVTIGKYESTTGWWDINSENDFDLIKDALKRHGFLSKNIHHLSGREATKRGIMEAIEKCLLAQADKNDVVVFHYSGHGQRIVDDNNEEIDGYDEALVPWDAPECPSKKKRGNVCLLDETYHGERHLRDDDLNTIIQQLRRKVGPKGNVMVSLDSCFSGTAARGPMSAKARGTKIALGFPAHQDFSTKEKKELGGGFYEKTNRTRGLASNKETALGSYVVFSAARHDQLAIETETDDKTPVGSLSYGLNEALNKAGTETRYNVLFESIRSTLKGLPVDNQPQIEGDVNNLIFSGQAIDQKPYIEVDLDSLSPTGINLKAGDLAGLLIGTRVEFHKAGTANPRFYTKIGEGTKTGEGKVVGSEPLVATVEFEEGTAVDKDTGLPSWAFVTDYSFGTLVLGVYLAEFNNSEVHDEIEQALRKKGVPVDLEVPKDTADINIFEYSKNDASAQVEVRIEDARLGIPILKPMPMNKRNVGDTIRRKLQSYAYSRYLKKLDIGKENPLATIEIVPVILKKECRALSKPNVDRCVERELDLDAFRSQGNNLELPIGTWFKLRVNLSGKEAYVSVLDLWPDGTIGLLWPPPRTRDKKIFSVNSEITLPALYQLGEPKGEEVFLLIATEQWINWEPFTTPDDLRSRGSMENLGPFAPLFANQSGARGVTNTTFSSGQVTTYDLPFTIIPSSN